MATWIAQGCVELFSSALASCMSTHIDMRYRCWAARFRRLAKDYKRLPEVLRGLHFLAFAILKLP